MQKIVIFLFLGFIALTQSSNEVERTNRHSELLKPLSNGIDHGPSHSKSVHLLGHRGEHWGHHANKKNKKMKKKKTNHSSGAHHDSLDDIRLQNLDYSPKKKDQGKNKATKTNHSQAYKAKLQRWKAKMMSKKGHYYKLKGNKTNTHRHNMP